MAGYRGRLIFPFMGRFALVDPALTVAAAVPSGYDDDFRETVMVAGPLGSPARGVDARTETLIDIPFQEDMMQGYDATRRSPFFTGSSPDADGWIIMHFSDLERLGLVDLVTGEPRIHRDGRLVSVHDFTSGVLIQEVRSPPGLYIHEVTPAFGFRNQRNLLFLHLMARELGSATAT